jgi:hypothetical protein
VTPESEVDKLIEKLRLGELEEVPDVFEFHGTVVHPPQPSEEKKPDAE